MKSKNSSVSDLVKNIINSKNVEYSVEQEEKIYGLIDENNIIEIDKLLISEKKYNVIAGIRILDTASNVKLNRIYRSVDAIFDRGDLILNRLCINLIYSHGFFDAAANKRMAQFIDCPDEPTKRYIRAWLLLLTKEQLKEFLDNYQPFSNNVEKLIYSIISFRSNTITLTNFMEQVSSIDDVAYREYARLLEYEGLRKLFKLN
ncbi:hypothetical protein C8N35_104296 [Breoghania corrubedonensis]|uniref:Uncharacterized protein n=1 Tax=Breoghania corrubedonensis TaxID=665038 RepID=A0A2T5VA91_9HYPH|nr:hypothetical protein [Breoghania corrubedonensis]PTW60670.1 hypothetical protein C8N35_104296 [Breoghania corrubedonensis]